MPAARSKKRKSEQSAVAEDDRRPGMASQQVATKSGTDDSQESPRKKRKLGITLAQKQALIDNLQLELTERARKLRAHYNLHAQNLRTRIEIRVNRVPLSLRKMKMGDLLRKYANVEKTKMENQAAASSAPPPVPEKDVFPMRPPLYRVPVTGAPLGSPMRHANKRSSHEMTDGDKENETDKIDNPKKKIRGLAGDVRGNTAQVLSPTSSNSRLRAAAVPSSPAKSLIARPVSPAKAGASILSNMVEKARSTGRAAANAATGRKTTTSSTASSANGATTRATRRAVPGRNAATTARTTMRRTSGASHTSDGSTSTVVRTRTAVRGAAAAPTPKKPVVGTAKKGATTRKGPADKKAAAAAAAAVAPTTTATRRVLRKRN